MKSLRMATIIIFAVALTMFVMLFDTILKIFFVTILASLMAIFFVGTADRIHKRFAGNEKLWISVLILLILGSSTIVVWISSAPVASQFDALGPKISPAVTHVSEWLSKFGLGQKIISATDEVQLTKFIPHLEQFASTVLESLAIFFVVLVTGIFLSYEPGRYRDGLLFFAQDKKRVSRIVDKLQDRLYRWTIGRLASMAVVFILTWIGLTIIGVPLSFLLALFAGILSFIPNFGPIISAVLAALVGLSESAMLAVWIVLMFIFIQLLESNFITPLIERKSVYLPPGLILIVQAFMGLTFGILGLVVATPIVVGALIIIKEYHS